MAVGGFRPGAGRKRGQKTSADAPSRAVLDQVQKLPREPGNQTRSMKSASARAQAAAEPYIEAAILELAKLAGLVLDKSGQPVGRAEKDRERLRALEVIIERAAGRPLQPIGGDDGGPLTVVIRKFTQNA